MMNTNSTSSSIPKKCPVCGNMLYPEGCGRYQCSKCGYSEITLPHTITHGAENSGAVLNDDFPNNIYGWVCPKCGSVMSPWTDVCPNCTKQDWNITCSTGGSAPTGTFYYRTK